MPNRWSPGCGCCGCHSCDGSQITGVSISISGLPSSATLIWSSGNTTHEETWAGLDNANGTWSFSLKSDPGQPDEPACFVDASQLCGSLTFTLKVTDPFGTNTVITNGSVYVTPFGDLRGLQLLGVVGVPINPGAVNPFTCDILKIFDDYRGFSDDVCVGMSSATASGSSCALAKQIASTGSTAIRTCVSSPANLIGDTVEADYSF